MLGNENEYMHSYGDKPLQVNINEALNPRFRAVMIGSFITCVIIHHIISPRFFKRYNSSYRSLDFNKRMEWDSRIVSTLHASIVSILCLISLFRETQLWRRPLSATGDIASTTLSISVGYFLCDLLSMLIYYRGKDLFIFYIHHLAAMVSSYLIVKYKISTFFGMYRLTTELSTPFTNQRWFYRTLGYTPNRRRVASVTLIFSILFAVTRNFLVIPYWFFLYKVYNSIDYVRAVELIPHFQYYLIVPAVVLDILNTYWIRQVYPIGYRAAVLLCKADWSTDINLAKASIHGRFQNARRRAMNSELLVSLRRTASFNRLQRVFGRQPTEEDLSYFSGSISDPEFDEDSGLIASDDSEYVDFHSSFSVSRFRSNSEDDRTSSHIKHL